MKKTGKNTLLGRMFAGWAKDAEIEEVAQAVEELCEGALTDELLHEELRADCGCEVLLKELKVAIEALIQKLDEKVFARDEDDPMSELLDELSGEAAVTVSEDEEEPVLDEEEIAQGGEESAEVAMAAIKAIQPIIAKLPEAEQFAAADAAARQIRRAMGRTPRPRVSGYRMALRGQLSRGSVRDSRNLGAEIMAKYNPHYK